MDSVGYGVLLGLSEQARGFLLPLFIWIVSVSRLPRSWGDTLVTFVPKAGSDKFRPISLTSTLCKTFERLIQKRLKFLAESKSWIPANQFGFRRGHSSMDCIACLVTDILQGFGRAEVTLALTLDFKGAYNAVLPSVLISQLIGLGVSRRIVDFVNCLTKKRMLHFSPSDDTLSLFGVHVLQGGVLPPVLFNLHLSRLNEILPKSLNASYAFSPGPILVCSTL